MKRARQFVFQFILLSVSIFTADVSASDWPNWRGPDNNGVSKETGVATSWSATENVKWRLPIQGTGPATPVIGKNHIFLTSVEKGEIFLSAVHTDGKKLWKKNLGKAKTDFRRDESHSAAPSPSTNGSYVWVFTGTGVLACFDYSGNEIWKLDVQEKYGNFRMYHGMSASPLLDGDRLYLALMHDNAQAVIAFEAKSGKELWNHKRETNAVMENLHSYASPIMYEHSGEKYLLTHGSDVIVAHSLEDGGELWRSGGLQYPGRYNNFLRFVASPVTNDGIIIVPSAKGGPVLAIKPPKGLRGDITNDEKPFAWKLNSGSTDVPSPLVYDGLVYMNRHDGILVCIDALTGEVVYKESVYRRRHRASPVYADGKIYMSAADGVVNVIKAGGKYELLATNKIDERLYSSIAIAGGVIYLRTFDALYAIQEKE